LGCCDELLQETNDTQQEHNADARSPYPLAHLFSNENEIDDGRPEVCRTGLMVTTVARR